MRGNQLLSDSTQSNLFDPEETFQQSKLNSQAVKSVEGAPEDPQLTAQERRSLEARDRYLLGRAENQPSWYYGNDRHMPLDWDRSAGSASSEDRMSDSEGPARARFDPKSLSPQHNY